MYQRAVVSLTAAQKDIQDGSVTQWPTIRGASEPIRLATLPPIYLESRTVSFRMSTVYRLPSV
jgi:hypothetical protein